MFHVVHILWHILINKMTNKNMWYVKYSNEHPITITKLNDVEQHFDLHIVVYNIPIYLFPHWKNNWVQHVKQMEIQTYNFHSNLFLMHQFW